VAVSDTHRALAAAAACYRKPVVARVAQCRRESQAALFSLSLSLSAASSPADAVAQHTHGGEGASRVDAMSSLGDAESSRSTVQEGVTGRSLLSLSLSLSLCGELTCGCGRAAHPRRRSFLPGGRPVCGAATRAGPASRTPPRRSSRAASPAPLHPHHPRLSVVGASGILTVQRRSRASRPTDTPLSTTRVSFALLKRAPRELDVIVVSPRTASDGAAWPSAHLQLPVRLRCGRGTGWWGKARGVRRRPVASPARRTSSCVAYALHPPCAAPAGRVGLGFGKLREL
jgi:hypothetical protein